MGMKLEIKTIVGAGGLSSFSLYFLTINATSIWLRSLLMIQE